MSEKFASANLTIGQINALVKAVGGEKVVRKILRGDMSLYDWRIDDNVIYFKVTSDGTTGAEWIERLKKNKDVYISDRVKSVLLSADFETTSGVTTEIAVLKHVLFSSKDHFYEHICHFGNQRNWDRPSAETACLILEKFSKRDFIAMGLAGITVMHPQIIDNENMARWLLIKCDKHGSHIYTHNCIVHGGFEQEYGFAFAVPKPKWIEQE